MKPNEFYMELNLGKKILSIKARDENHSLLFRQAESRINQKMEYYKKKYHINDESTFYLMICLDFVTDLIKSENDLKKYQNHLEILSLELQQALSLNLDNKNLTESF
jgi:hypothetical protein